MLARQKVFANEPINGQASVISRVFDIRHFAKVESLYVQVVSVSGTPDLKVEYAGGRSPADTDFESFDDHTDVVVSTAALPSPEGFGIISMPEPKAGFLKLKFTGLATNPTDSLLTSELLVRE